MINLTGDHLKEIRLKLDMTQEDLAKHPDIDVSRVTVVRWESLEQAALPRAAQDKISSFLKNLYEEKKNKKLATQLGAASIGALFAGPIGAILAGSAASFLAEDATLDKCPWCEKAVSSLEENEEAKYLCADCGKPFQFIPGIGTIRIAY